MLGHTTGARNIAFGYAAMDDTDAGSTSLGSSDNIFIGYDAGGGTWTDAASQYNVAIGNYVMDSALQGANGNTGVGHQALSGVTTGGYNTAIGRQSLTLCAGGSSNTALGNSTMQSVTSGAENTGLGSAALLNVATKSYNVAVGNFAGRYGGATGTSDVGDAVESSTFLGWRTRSQDATGYANEIVIGADAVGNGANTATIGYHLISISK